MYHYEKWNKGPIKRYVFSEPWRFVLKVRPNMITKIRKIDAELESRMQEINSFLKRNDYQGRLSRLKGERYKWKEWKLKNYEKHTEADLFNNKPLLQVLDMIKESRD
jgi:hypothetical protein